MSFRPARETVTRPRRREAVTTGCQHKNRGQRRRPRRPIDSHIITHRATERKKISTAGGQRHSEKTYSFQRAGLTGVSPHQSRASVRACSRVHSLSLEDFTYLRLRPNSPQGRSTVRQGLTPARSKRRFQAVDAAPGGLFRTRRKIENLHRDPPIVTGRRQAPS